MSLDIGGTSADVAVIIDGQPQYGVGEQIGDFQIHIPRSRCRSIGEGGGSIAWIDALGVLKVGPESAGSTPGPACYGRGGTRADDHRRVRRARLGRARRSSATAPSRVDRAQARAAVGELGRRLGRSARGDRGGDHRASPCRACTSEVSGLVSRFGIDPRDFACLAFGGAGPMMACFLARELGMREVVVPPTPGVLSALGGLIADLKNDFIKTVYVDLDAGRAARRSATTTLRL